MFKVTIYHILKLFHTGTEVVVSKKPLVSEFYEEVIFQEPTQYMKQLLTIIRPLSISPYRHETDCKFQKFLFCLYTLLYVYKNFICWKSYINLIVLKKIVDVSVKATHSILK